MSRKIVARACAIFGSIAIAGAAVITTPARGLVPDECQVMWNFTDAVDTDNKKHANEGEWPGTGWVTSGDDDVLSSEAHDNFESGFAFPGHTACDPGGIEEG